MNTKILRYPSVPLPLQHPVCAALGNFDGIHLGHQKILDRVRTLKGTGGTAILVSFYPHPTVVLGALPALPSITTLHQKTAILSSFDFDFLYLIHFTKTFSKVPAKQFMDSVLLKTLQLDHLVIGPDATIGHGREGTVPFIQNYLKERGKNVEVVPFIDLDGKRIGSKAIRECLRDGRLGEANKLLGRNYILEARVVKGDSRGRGLGFPTANLKSTNQRLPKEGIYATLAHVEGKIYPSATSVGKRPTFGGVETVVETHLLSYNKGSLYGKHLEVEFIEWIRDEQKFETVEALIAAMHDDIDQTKKILQRYIDG